MVLPERVKTPQAPTLVLASEFWTAEAAKPAQPPTRAPWAPDLTEFFWWKGSWGNSFWMGRGFAILDRWGGTVATAHACRMGSERGFVLGREALARDC